LVIKINLGGGLAVNRNTVAWTVWYCLKREIGNSLAVPSWEGGIQVVSRGKKRVYRKQ
jgi:hypothetical protein